MRYTVDMSDDVKKKSDEVRFTVVIPDDLYHRIKTEAVDRRTTVKRVITEKLSKCCAADTRTASGASLTGER